MNHHETPAILSKAIGQASKLVKSVTYDFPAVWYIDTAEDQYALGNMDGDFGWHNIEGTKAGGYLGLENAPAQTIALAFAKWLEEVEGN